MPVTVRAARPDDLDAMLAVHKASWIDTYAVPGGVSIEWIEEAWAPRLTPESLARQRDMLARTNERVRAFVAIADEQIVGLLWVTTAPAPSLDAIYVAREFHGTGVGPALMDTALALIPSGKSITVRVATFNARAIRFYEKYGFATVTGSDATYAGAIPELTMVRPARS